MAAVDSEVDDVLSTIENTGLPHPLIPFLQSYVSDAVHPVLAARYVKPRLELGEASSLAADWTYIIESIAENGRAPPEPDAAERHDIFRRDAGRCSLTGKNGTPRDPLVIVPVLPVSSGWVTDKPDINEMLGAYFGPPYRDWWLSYARDPKRTPAYFNHWLVQESAAKAFSLGIIKLHRMNETMLEWEFQQLYIQPVEDIEVNGLYALLGDFSRSGISSVDPRFVGTQARLCRSIQFLAISKNIAQQSIPRPSSTLIGRGSKVAPRRYQGLWNLCKTVLLTVWRLAPVRVKVACYKRLKKLGERLYGNTDDNYSVQQLPFGLFMKYYGQVERSHNEFNALQMVRRHTSVPVPEALDISLDLENPNDPRAFVLTTTLPGLQLWSCQHILSDNDLERIATQLKDYIAQLRDIPRPAALDMAICNTVGEGCTDNRIRGGILVGPFPDEEAFSQILRYSDDPARRGHEIVFTHADLNPRNILIDQTVLSDGTTSWDVTGIVDWETAGFFPEYWDYTKAMFEGFRWMTRYNNMVHGVFNALRDYSEEFDIEKRSWESGDGV
ncbi:hypothetical protein GGR52DRAFT_561098 [Hypoxylon sp. FL1284]|nr:hypothetical protein GGR52DRAFT_561098 [Hypoxylon sp. FL1284]